MDIDSLPSASTAIGGEFILYPRDVFISHASENKESHARPLNEALNAAGVSTWFDEVLIRDGDSLVDSVGLGLDRATFVVLIVTPEFIAKGWPQTELRNALSKEISSGVLRVIPVVDVPHDNFVSKFPLMQDKKYARWSPNVPDQLTASIQSRLNRRPSDWYFGIHPTDYTGEVWIRITPTQGRMDDLHKVRVIWGQYTTSIEVSVSGHPVSLVHHKIHPDGIPLQVHVEPKAIVTFGQGPAPDPLPLYIDEGWVRMAGTPIVP